MFNAAVKNATDVGELSPRMSQRIDSMYAADRLWALGFVLFLWATYFFVFFAIGGINQDESIFTAMLIGGALVLVYNTASILAMIKHYKEDKAYIYSLDIRHLDEMRHDKAASHHVE